MNPLAREFMARIHAGEKEKYGRILTDEERLEIDRLQDEEAAQARERKKAYDQELWATKELGRIPKRFQNVTFENYRIESGDQQAAVDHLKSGQSAIIYGANGLGKTHLAFASIKHQIAQGRSARYLLAFEFVSDIKQSWGKDTTKNLMSEYGSCDYLVIDEIDKTFGSQTDFIYLYSLVNERYNEMLPTVLITNAKESELLNVIGPSTLSRVAGDGALIELDGDDFRKRNRA